MNNKKNNAKGYRGEIIKLIGICGIIPYESLRLLKGTARVYQRVLLQMEREGIVQISKRGKDRYVQYANERKKEIQSSLPKGWEEYYKKNANKETSRMTENKIETKERAVRVACTQIMMYASGIEVSPDKKQLERDTLTEEDTIYYTSKEIKRYGGYKDSAKKAAEGNKIIQNSRLTGWLHSPGGQYSVYNIGDHLIEWKRYGEVKMQTYLKMLHTKCSAYSVEQNKESEAIIISKKLQTYVDICLLEYARKKETRVILMNIDYAYNRMYAVPQNRDGEVMLQMMCKRGWKNKIYNSILSTDEINARRYEQIPCDGYNKEEDIYKLVFCVPDLVRLKSFTARALLEENRERFAIYCYTWQTPIVYGLAEDSVNIYQIPIETMYSNVFQQ